MKLKFLLGGLSALVAVGGIANLAQAQSSISTVSPNSDAVLTIDQTDSLSSDTTDPLAIRGMQAHTATPTNVLVMEGEMVRSYPIASITGSGTSDSLVANADGSYTHTAADGTEVIIAAPAAAVTSSLTANADGSYTHNDGTGTEVIIPAPAAAVTSSLTANADGSYTHNDGTGTEVIIPAPVTDTLMDNNDRTYTHTAVDGTVTVINTWDRGPISFAPTGATDDDPLEGTKTFESVDEIAIVLRTNPNPFRNWGIAAEVDAFAVNYGQSAMFQINRGGADVATLKTNDQWRWNKYGEDRFNSNTYHKILGVTTDGDVIEVDPTSFGAGATSSLAQNPDGTYTHSDGAATPTTLSFDTSNAWHPASDVTATASAVGSTAEDIWFDAGQVGIGVVPSEMLHVAGNALLTGNLYTNSDSRLKTNIVEFEGSLASVMNIEPVTFNWIDEDAHTTGTQLGFIAQDVQAALPEAVIVSEDELGTLSVADRPILAASIGAIQELKAENDALKAELEDMKSQMQQMELLQLAVMSMQAQLADMAQSDAMMKANFSL